MAKCEKLILPGDKYLALRNINKYNNRVFVQKFHYNCLLPWIDQWAPVYIPPVQIGKRVYVKHLSTEARTERNHRLVYLSRARSRLIRAYQSGDRARVVGRKRALAEKVRSLMDSEIGGLGEVHITPRGKYGVVMIELLEKWEPAKWLIELKESRGDPKIVIRLLEAEGSDYADQYGYGRKLYTPLDAPDEFTVGDYGEV